MNAPMRVRQDRRGHEKADTTLGYTHAIGGDDRRIADEICEIFAQLCPNRLRLMPLTANIYNAVAVMFFSK
jgi:hypothetical protein